MRIRSFIIFFLLGILTVQAQDKVLKFSYRHFTTENGLSQNSVEDALFDNKGFLWLSIRTDNVFIYDGYRFNPCWYYKNGKRFSFKSATLFRNSYGDIFISHENGFHVRKKDTNEFEEVSNMVINRENEKTFFIGEGDHKEVYFYNRGELYSIYRSGNGDYVTDSICNIGIMSLYYSKKVKGVSKASYFWYARPSDATCYLFDIKQRKTIREIRQEGRPNIAFFGIDSTLYEVDNSYQLFKTNGQEWKSLGQLGKVFQERDVQWLSNTFINDSTGEIFVSSDKYVYKFDRDFSKFTSEITNTIGEPVLSKGGINMILQQDAAHLWFFTTAEGFYQLDIRPKKFEHFKTDIGALNFVRSIYKDEKTGYVFSGLFYGGLIIYDSTGKIIKNLPFPRLSKVDRGGFCVNGIIKLSANTYLIWYNAGRAYILNTVDWSMKSIINEGELWRLNSFGPVIDYIGFLQMEDSRFVTGYKNRVYFFDIKGSSVVLKDSIVSPIFRPEGFYYQAPFLYYGGIGSYYRYHTGTKKIDSFAIPLTTKVKWISRDNDDRLWLSTETGITIIKNDKVVRTLTTDDGLPNQYIYVAEPDSKGKMWCSSNKGIFSIDVNNYSVTGYSTVDGLQSEEFNTASFWRDHTGNFYFGGVNGLNFFNPSSMKERGDDAMVHIGFIGSGDSVIYQYANNEMPSAVNLSYKNTSLLLRFSALNYKTQGFNQYEYKLHGSDEKWEDNGNNNELQLSLSPGQYSIRIRLKNLPQSEVQLKVYIRPPFYQTIWFALLVIAGIAALVTLLVNRHNKNKYRKKIAVLEMQQKIQEEKERIARDLHDDIGTRVNMLAYNVSKLGETNNNEELKEMRERMKSTSDDMMQSLKETVWTLKQEHITVEDVWTRFKNFIVKLQQTYSAIQFRIDENGPSGAKVNYNEALNLIRILQEAVNNAIKHSGCKVISCSRSNVDGKIIFIVRDDGKGFDHMIANSLNKGNGLQNMEQRAHESGFDLTMDTAENKGTTIIIKV